MTENEYRDLLEKWVCRLGLSDWRIALKTDCTPDEMPMSSAGCAEIAESVKCACIYILDPKCHTDRLVPFDGEEILVHELLHLKLALIQDVENDLQERYVHQILDDLARALVDAERGTEE